ncbi:hypothetical protein PF003_g24011 [Phytophthora fragariae]|nr:hypothetical protein PF003_g24011 [Phytophthora fragariae]
MALGIINNLPSNVGDVDQPGDLDSSRQNERSFPFLPVLQPE